MITVVEPKKYISSLWSNHKISEDEMYRLMQYVIKLEYKEKVILHNVVTGHLAILKQDEIDAISQLPMAYVAPMKQLIDEHFLVPVSFDEHKKVLGIRKVLRKLSCTNSEKPIISYTILPTTACNARCYYCFEKGAKIVTMTEDTANDVAQYISEHCGEKKSVHISWFGGEPTVAQNRIDQICEGLQEKDINYWSEITTNGYLFDEDLVKHASSLWNLQSVMISLDGTENSYNAIKAYVNAKDNPYQRVLRNVGYFLENQIHVNLRMNFDLSNYDEFPELVNELIKRFGKHPYLHVRAHPINGEYKDQKGKILHGTDEWFERKVNELNEIARKVGLQKSTRELPFLRYEGCEANDDSSVTISAEGTLVRCCEQFDKNQTTGNLKDGIIYPERVRAWKEFADYEKCFGCMLYPRCNRLVLCSSKDRCNYYLEMVTLINNTIIQLVNAFIIRNDNNQVFKEEENEVSRT